MKKISVGVCLLLFVMTIACSGSDDASDDQGETPMTGAPNFTTQSSYTNSIILNWEELSGATKYEIRYGNKEDLIDPSMAPTNETSLEIKNLEKGNSYFFQVRAGLKSGWSEWSKVKKINTASFKASITTYNVLSIGSDPKVGPDWAWAVRTEALKQIILQDNNNPDIISFQESNKGGEEIKQMIIEKYDTHISKREAVSASLIAWKSDKFELVDFNDDIDIFGSEVTGGDGARYVGHVRLREKETGKELLVYSVHVPASTNKPKKEGQRIRQIGAQNLATYAKQKSQELGIPAAVMGDFNNYFDTVVEGIQSAPKTMSENGFEDTFQGALNRTNEDVGTAVNRNTFSIKPGKDGSKRLDYIFTYPKEQVSVGDYSIIVNFEEGSSTRLQRPVPSDHHPVKSVLYFTYY